MLVKLEWLRYRTVKKRWQYVQPFSCNTSMSRTDRQTDGRTELLYQYRASVFWRAIKMVGWLPTPRAIMRSSFKVKVTRPTNAETESVLYLPNGNDYELQTWYTDGARRLVSTTSSITSKVKGQDRNVTWCVWQVLAHKLRTKTPINTKIGTGNSDLY